VYGLDYRLSHTTDLPLFRGPVALGQTRKSVIAAGMSGFGSFAPASECCLGWDVAGLDLRGKRQFDVDTVIDCADVAEPDLRGNDLPLISGPVALLESGRFELAPNVGPG